MKVLSDIICKCGRMPRAYSKTGKLYFICKICQKEANVRHKELKEIEERKK